MMKCEFEEMIGKEVSVETFEKYEAMYFALPENVNKQQFVEMLNIEAIPESSEAIARRAEREKIIEEIKTKIVELKVEYEQENSETEKYFFPSYSAKRRKEIKAEIKMLKQIIA